MINPKLSSVPAKNPPILVLDLIKLQIVKKTPLLKTLKHFYKIAQFFYHVVSSYQGENANKALFIYFDRRAIINQN